MDTQREQLDVFDEQMNRIGTATRADVHTHGYWHQTFQCWVVAWIDRIPSLLFQKRHRDKDTHPNCYDITCAGHLLAGETPLDGLRELEEELGLHVSSDELTSIGILRVPGSYAHMIDNEFCHVFLYAGPSDLSRYRLQQDEVTGLVHVPLADVHALFHQQIDTIAASGIEVSADGRSAPVQLTLQRSDFVPHGDAYYHTIIAAAQQMAAQQNRPSRSS